MRLWLLAKCWAVGHRIVLRYLCKNGNRFHWRVRRICVRCGEIQDPVEGLTE